MKRTTHLNIAAFCALLAAAALAAVLLSASQSAEATELNGDPESTSVTQLSDGTPVVAGEVLVGYKGEDQPRTVEIAENADPEVVADQIEDSTRVRYAIPNYVASISGWMPNDHGVNPNRKGKAAGWRDKQWNFLPCLSFCHDSLPSDRKQSRGGMNVIRSWQHLRKAGRPGANGVKVAVLDTGIAYRDYGRRFRRSPDLGPNRFLPGYDFVANNRLPLDRHGHGTHVASTIGEQTNNRTSLTGIAYRSKLMPIRVMDANGDGNTRDIAAGIRWAARKGARVIVMSLNFKCGLTVPPVQEAINQAWRKGVVMVASSGNRGNIACPGLPATSPRVISVGGTTESGCVASYTFQTSTIDLAAPGGGASRPDCPWTSRDRPILQLSIVARTPNWFGIEPSWVGTSMAAAHVGGAAAAVIASKVLGKKAGPKRVRERLEQTARMPAYLQGQTATGAGSGIVNLGRATNPSIPISSQ